jgi:hypothetical protein
MMMQAIMQPMFNNLFNPPSAGSNAQAKKAREEAEKARAAAEAAKREALAKWAKAQSDEEIRKEVERQDKIRKGEKVLSQMQTVGGGKLEPFSFSNPKLEIQPIDRGGFQTAGLDNFERLMCAAFFSDLGKRSSTALDAKFYSDQAERVMSGQPTHIECRVPKPSGAALAARTKAVKKIYEEANIKIGELDKIEIKLTEANEKVAAATTKKEEAASKVKELEARAAENPPEQKEENDDLVARAQKELEDAEKEAGDAQRAQQDLTEKKSRIENDLNAMKSKMQAGLQAE